jgi:hypothetical protein
MNSQTIKFGSVPAGDEFKPVFDEPILVVLSVNPNKPVDEREWAVYAGPESKGEEYILKYGTKLSKEFAQLLFPNVRGRYRL